jgi:hypothetical protein
MPWADDIISFNFTFIKRTSSVRTGVRYRIELSANICNENTFAAKYNLLQRTNGEFDRLADLDIPFAHPVKPPGTIFG